MKEKSMVVKKIPSAGGDAVPGGYPAQTPHAAAVAQTPYQAPSSSMDAGGGPAHGGYDAMESGLGMPTRTPGEAMESPQRYDES